MGCLHIRPFVDLSRPDEIARMRAVAEEIKDLVREFGGVNSSEHGDGLARSEFNREIFGDRLYEAMRSVKQLFDPQHLLNPGKIVDAPPMTENLRDAALPPPVPFRTRLDFSVIGGMRGAADRCMNIGLCRKSTTGVMCPSYIATREEEHATRGRANALVKALSEPDPAAALGDERLHEILDLCLMCKACKAECPLGVDMAKLKSETLAHHHDRHGVPLRSRVFAAIRRLNRLGLGDRAAVQPARRDRAAARVLGRALGIARQRPLPRFERQNLLRWFRRHRRAADAPAPTQGTVNFLADSFTSFTEPQHRAGRGRACWRPPAGRSGWRATAAAAAPSLSKGLLDDAAAKARALVTALARAPRRTRRSSAASRRACSRCATSTLSLLPGDPHVARGRRPGPAGRGAAGRGDRRRPAGAAPPTRGWPAAGCCSTATATRRRRSGRPRPSALLRRIPGVERGRAGRRLLRHGRVVRLRGRALRRSR